jgi:hypothetical protein
MDISPQHAAFVHEACQIPALYARLELLAQPDLMAPERSQIAFYASAKPVPGEPPGIDPIVTLNLTRAAGSVNEGAKQLVLNTPVEAQITGADPAGSIPLWARITTWNGLWWGDATVTHDGGGGDIEVLRTGLEDGQPVVRWYQGAYVRLAAFTISG